jgi:hypothetical protein
VSRRRQQGRQGVVAREQPVRLDSTLPILLEQEVLSQPLD